MTERNCRRTGARTRCFHVRAVEFWVAHASRVLVSASRRNNLFDGRASLGPIRCSAGKSLRSRGRARSRRRGTRRVRYPIAAITP
ncbi:MAG: hypothetical protein DME76_08195 [Verrucomicrobia bacterium]|nr:MAG: hypothetical protein DME76_08195 [Verrucomicrobiota bacterium]